MYLLYTQGLTIQENSTKSNSKVKKFAMKSKVIQFNIFRMQKGDCFLANSCFNPKFYLCTSAINIYTQERGRFSIILKEQNNVEYQGGGGG